MKTSIYCTNIILITIFLSFVISETPISDKESKTEEDDDIQELIRDAVDYAHAIGLIIRSNENPHKSDHSAFTPVTLYPTPVPRAMFEKAVAVREAMTLLYFRVSRNVTFLEEVLGEVARSDYSTRMLLEILRDVHAEGIHQPIGLLLQRADYMFNENKNAKSKDERFELKQIEVNNGPIGGMVVQHATTLHRRMMRLSSMPASPEVLPDNPAYDTIAQGLFKAWQQFGDPNAIVIMVIGRFKNPFQFEQKQLEYELEKLSGDRMRIMRLNLFQCDERLTMDDDFTLRLDGEVVGVVYFRLGLLIPVRLQTPQGLRVRRLVERSTAIKSPPIGVELATAKKVQQVLAMPGQLERFFPKAEDAETVALIRSTFAGLWGLENDDEKTRAIIQDAIAHPDNYVLKPNREGGGHNFWGQEIVDKLTHLTPQDRIEHILQQRLHPPVTQNYLLKAKSDPTLANVVTELSTYGALLGNLEDGTVLYNKGGGHLMRTKIESVTEGGIMEGSGFYDTPYLYD